ncbi:MAG TPA: acyl-CoA dehydrogenase family protein [Caulobacteraceae bacterium]|jgi:alkylation response protein AidB-like acyl-CoA dehydrogenase
MEFALTEDQVLLQDSLGRTLERACPLERVRQAAADKEAFAPDVWSGLSELGLAGLIIPPDHGGLGLGLLDAALAAETLGHAVAPTPFIASAVLAPLALMGAGSAQQRAQWLPRLAAGEVVAGVAIAEAAGGARDGAGITAASGQLSGKALFVLDGAAADLFVVADREGGLHLIEAGAAGLARSELRTIDSTRSVCELNFDKARAEPLSTGDALATLARMIDAGRIVLAADILGAGQCMIDKAVAYAGERSQFGRLIGSFQAVKHLCAEMTAELEPCRALAWYAAYAFDAMPDQAGLMAAHAKAHLSEVGTFVARTATEVHGGMGFTDLTGLHYWFKRIGFDRQMLGGPERLRHHAAVVQGWVKA